MTAVAVSPYTELHALTVDDWFALPDDGNRYELLEGMLVLMPVPSLPHQSAVGRIGASLLAQADRRGGLATFSPLGVALSRTIAFEPDVVYLSAERIARARKRGIEGAPDIVVEVLSPGTASYDRRVKLALYFEAGVREVWLVDLEARTVAVHTSPADAQSCTFGDRIPSAIVDAGSAGLEKVIAFEEQAVWRDAPTPNAQCPTPTKPAARAAPARLRPGRGEPC